HIPGAASRLAALLIAHVCPIRSLFAPCDPGAAPGIFVTESPIRDTIIGIPLACQQGDPVMSRSLMSAVVLSTATAFVSVRAQQAQPCKAANSTVAVSATV